MTSTSTPRSWKMCDGGGRKLVGDEDAGPWLASPCGREKGRRPSARGGVSPSSRSWPKSSGLRLRRPGEFGRDGGEGPVEPGRQRLEVGGVDGGAAPDPQARRARRGSRRRRGRRLPSPAPRPASWRSPPAPSRRERGDRGSTTFRQTEVLERVAGSLGEEGDPGGLLRPSLRARARLASARRFIAGEAADRGGPVQRVEVVLDAEHRGRVDRRALEDVLGQLAALGHAEQLRQRPGGRVALQPRDRARRQDQHAVRRLAAQRLLPGEGDDIELRPVERLGEGGRGGVADGDALAVGRR